MSVLSLGIRKNICLLISVHVSIACSVFLVLADLFNCFVIMSICTFMQALLCYDRVYSCNMPLLNVPATSFVLSMHGAVMYGYAVTNLSFTFGTNLLLPGGILLNWFLVVLWMCNAPRPPVQLEELKVIDNCMHCDECEDESKHNNSYG